MVARNLLTPFRRDRKRDLATGEGEELLASKVRQVLLTEGSTPRSSGELPWRTNFGAGLGLLRHRANDGVLAELAHVMSREALRRWLPEVELLELRVEQAGPVLSLRIRVQRNEGAATAVLSLHE
jgi:uncharacterized protein